MGIIQNVRDFFRSNPSDSEQLDTTMSGGYFMLNNSQYDPTVSKTFEFLKNCGNDYEILKGKQQARLSEMMYEIFPFVKRAMNDMAGMVGNAEILSIKQGDVPQEDLDALRELAEKLPILSEHNHVEPSQMGADNLIYRTAKGMLLNGLYVIQDRYDDDLNYQGVLPFYSMNFDYQYFHDRYILRYRNLEDVVRGPFTDWVGYDWRENDPFPHPLLSGGRFFTRLVLSVFVAIQNISLRKGAPVQLMLIGVDNDEVLKNPQTLKIYKDNVTAWKDRTEKAVENQQKGIQSPIVGTAPANIKLVSETFGAEMVNEIGYQTLDRVMAQAVQLLGIPPELAGIVLGSAGFSPERFRIQYQIWSGKIDNLRTEISGTIWKRMLNFYRANDVDPALLERVCLGFEEVDMADAKEKAEISALEAQTQERQAKVMDQLNMSVGTEAAMEYAQTVGLIEVTE